MKYLIFIFFILISGCIENDSNEFKKSCPYDLKYSGHYLKVPITITPHKINYNIGDTIKISTIFSDSIYDLGTEKTFKIKQFPFKPLSLLYRFYNGMKWDAGYRVNELLIDSSYNHIYNYSSNYADGFRAKTTYENGIYKFELKLVLKEKGRYILAFTDMYQEHDGGGNSELNTEANAITFEGKCPQLKYYICSMIEGDNYLLHFEDELVYLDNNVYRKHLGSNKNAIKFLNSGGIRVEFSGYYGFEVK